MIDINLLMNISQRKTVPKGTIITREGEFDDAMHIILKGTVGVIKDLGGPNQIHLETLSQGHFFGEMTLFLHKERVVSCIALEDVVLMELTRMNAFTFFEKQPIATYSLIVSLCERLHKISSNYDELLSKNPEETEEAEEDTSEQEDSIETIRANIFPEGHKQYELSLDEHDKKLLVIKGFTCPVCDRGFETAVVRRTMLRQIKTDNDLRVHYKGIEPIYYDVISCPHCRFSSFEDSHGNVMGQRADKARREIYRITHGYYPDFTEEKTAETIFASHYLALKAASLCIMKPELVIARLWLRISWLYCDCEDADMEKYATEQALSAYNDVYQKMDLTEEQTQQVCLIIGELSYKTGDILTAKNFLHNAKTNRNGSPMLRNIADIRLSEVKTLVKELTGK